uniref:SWIM-type domain-containing protein n=1 Tax=Setaria italica TaxID=4555 RepID=K3YQH6_SETIT
MGRGQIVAVLQVGGEFSTDDDGHMSYYGGEAHAMHVKSDWTFKMFKHEISSTLNNLKLDSYVFKYFLPRNDKTLISISNDKDLRRMVDFHAESETTYIYVMKKADNRLKSSISDSGTPADSAIIATTPDGSKRQKICASWENAITGVGQVFEGPKEFRDALHKYAIAHRFHYRFVKNDSSRVTAECTDEGCTWRIHASKSHAKEFAIKKVFGTHTCESETIKSHRLASQKWVASVIKEKIRDSPNYRPRDIANDLQREYGLCLNYSQAWRGKAIARKELYSSHEEACNQLPWFCQRIVETNPGSVATLEALEDSKFRFFVAFHASLHGFEHGCRPLLFLDVISVRSNKHWKLLAATSVDSEGDIFPVALSVVDDESQENWHWFLEQLKASLPALGAITFISNEYKKQLDDSWSEEVKDTMVEHLKKAIYSCKVDEFNQYVELIKAESDKLAEWLLETKPERWSDAFFKGSRLGQYTCNVSETIAEWIPSRYELSVVQLVDTIRCNLMEMMYARRESSNACTELLTPSANQKLQEQMNKALTLNVVCSTGSDGNSHVFEVCDDSVHVVNINTRECTCRKWNVSGIPCSHAIAVFDRTEQCPLDYCDKYFTTEYYRWTYAMSINPIPDVLVPTVAGDPSHGTILHLSPILTRRQVGRPKEKPADPRIAIKRAVRCSRCKGYGHNKATCKVPITA